MSVVQVNTNDEFKEVLKANDKVAVDFFATWCGPCKIIGPKFQQMATEPAFSGIKFIKVDVDENDVTASELSINAMPTFKFFKGGVECCEVVGASEEKLRSKLTDLSQCK